MKRKILVFLKVFIIFSLFVVGIGYLMGGLPGIIAFVAIEFAGIFTGSLLVKLASYKYVDKKGKNRRRHAGLAA